VSRRDLLRGSVAAAGGLVLASSVPAFARGVKAADFVLVNGFVWTVDPSFPVATAVAVRNGRIVYVGNDRGAHEHAGAGTEVINLKGRMVMPGIHDGHVAVLSDAGDLTLRPHVALYVAPESLADPNAALGSIEDMRAMYARPDVTVNTVKLFLDGLIEYPSHTAAMIDAYRENVGTPDHPHWVPSDESGPTYFPPDMLNPGLAALDTAGWQVHMHAIGDRAVRSGLDAIEFARDQNGDLDNRHTLAHIEAIHYDEYKRFRQLNAMACMQMQWAERDSYTMRKLKPYIGPSRWSRLYAAGSLEAAGARLCGGSDWPVDPLLPFRQIEMAVNRTADEVYKGGDEPLNPAQAITLRSSIEMHTRNSAFQLHQAAATGAITRGRRADLVVLDRNLFDVKLTEVSTTKVLMTMVDGQVVHLKPELIS
jgi:predicted amidohydrolase YtcJ